MFELQSFLAAAQAAESNASLVLSNEQGGVTTRSGRFARWTRHLRLAENHEVASRFVQALNSQYGAELTRRVAESQGLIGGLRRVRPLSSRRVQQVVQTANNMQAEVRQDTQRFAACAQRMDAAGVSTESVKTEIARALATHLPGNPAAAGLVDCRDIPEAVGRAIVAAGHNGRHRVDAAEARRIRADVVEREVGLRYGDYLAAKALALEALRPGSRDSVTDRALAAAFAGCTPRLTYKADSLSPAAVEALYGEFCRAIESGRTPVDQLDNRAVLQALAQEVVGRFMDERNEARARIAGLEIPGEREKNALLAQVTFDNIPADLAARLGEAYLLVRADLDRLTSPLDAEEQRHLVANLREVIVSTTDAAGIEVNAQEEGLQYRRAWRFLLAPVEVGGAKEMLGQLAHSRSPLRAIGEAAAWYADEFKETVQGNATAERIFRPESFKNANECSQVMRSLWEALYEKAGHRVVAGAPLLPNAEPTDQTIATLRNLGIPFPAPDPLGRFSWNVPLSQAALAEMQQQLDLQVRDSRAIDGSGLTTDCMRFLRANEGTALQRYKARFRIAGTDLPRDAKASTVARALQDFCRDEDGTVNEEQLANVSRVVNPATLDCVYAGCMNPERPDLAIMNGYPRGVFEGHSYSLWRDERGECHLGIAEMITPMFFYPVDQDTVLPPRGQENDEAAQPVDRVVLSASRSDFRTAVQVKFDANGHRPEIDRVQLGYAIFAGDPEPPYWISPFEAGAEEHALEPELERPPHMETPL